MQQKQGSLSCVGIGMMLGAHITPISKSYIETADVVFVLVSNGIVEQWIEGMNADVRSLQPFYNEGTSRLETYSGMVEAIMTEVRAGKKVCGVFYGHPGVFACVPHKAISKCEKEGFKAVMQPGISAEDCLIADLGIDPGKYGCAQYETSQFMFYKRQIDPSAYLILWQIGIAGDQSLARFSTGAAYREVLVDLLLEHYPADHEMILYEAAVLPIQSVRKEIVKLSELPDAKVELHTTLVVPPAHHMTSNEEVRQKLDQLDNQFVCLEVETD